MFYEVIPTKLFRQDSGVLTYSHGEKLLPGQIVRIPLGRSHSNGIILRSVPPVNFPTRPIEKVLYPTPLPSHLLKSILWLSDYYLAPLPSVASLALPIGLEKSRRDTKNSVSRNMSDLGGLTEFSADLQAYEPAANEGPATAGARRSSLQKILLNQPQKSAISSLIAAPSGTKLLRGVTGSGKTNIYLELTAETIQKGQSVILLVPEIALTSQLVQIFCSTFAPDKSSLETPAPNPLSQKHTPIITLLHSRQTESERHQAWAKILTTPPDQPQIIIGPRSALFAPVRSLGLIIIDEAHESAYYQENSPKYSALRLASFMASVAKINCILGSATPSVTDYYLAKAKNSLTELNQKAKSSATTPDIKLIKLSERQNFSQNRYFSDPLLAAISRNLANQHQTLIFHNRRGSAPLTICEKCGWQALCPSCLLPLVLHADSFTLTCHSCGFSTPLPHSCPDCSHPSIVHKGFGTKLLEAELKKLFKDAKIARFDADNKKQETLDQLYSEVKSGAYHIIIGTQTVAKGLDLPHLATVGIVQADAGLSLPDYSSEERCFELITQVIGRVGRGHLPTAEVFIQTFQPNHPVIESAVRQDYSSFANYLLAKRRAALLPPFAYLARLTVSYKTESTTLTKIRQIHRQLSSRPGLILTPPTPAFHEQSSRGFTWQILIKSRSRAHILKALKSLPAPLYSSLKISLDPPSLL